MSESDQEFDAITATARLRIGSQKLELKLVVPADSVPPESLLPSLHQLSDRVVEGVEDRVQRNGLEISCRKGCGACCRQPVPISPAEARLLADIVSTMPEEAQSVVRERFDKAMKRLRESGLEEVTLNYHRLAEDEVRSMAHEYFKLGIPCPFLEDEACSIHPFRPLVCREYLVISSPDHCATLAEDEIKRLQFPVSVAGSFAGMTGVAKPGENIYLPLIMALEWSDSHTGETDLKPGPEWVRAFFENLTGDSLPAPPGIGTAVELSDTDFG